MSGARAWFDGRSLRERRMILIMLALLALTIVWGGIIRPVRDGLASARERHADAVIRLAGTESELAAIKAAGRQVPLTGSLADAIRLRADAAGLPIGSLDEPGAGRLHLVIPSARAAALARWVAQLERAGVLIESANWRDNGDATVAADLVLRARGA